MPTLEERFWAKVNKSDGCWTWTACKTSAGYGQIGLNGKVVLAHRVSYEMAFGPIPGGLFICHHCDNRQCVRPDHLFAGTQSDNMRDCVAKGRIDYTLVGKTGPCRRSRAKAFCVNGHAMTPENIYRSPSRPDRRACRECMRSNLRRSRRNRKDLANRDRTSAIA